jgi:hypothetical protein
MTYPPRQHVATDQPGDRVVEFDPKHQTDRRGLRLLRVDVPLVGASLDFLRFLAARTNGDASKLPSELRLLVDAFRNGVQP